MLCEIICTDKTKYQIRTATYGKLIEINEALYKDPNLAATQVREKTDPGLHVRQRTRNMNRGHVKEINTRTRLKDTFRFILMCLLFPHLFCSFLFSFSFFWLFFLFQSDWAGFLAITQVSGVWLNALTDNADHTAVNVLDAPSNPSLDESTSTVTVEQPPATASSSTTTSSSTPSSLPSHYSADFSDGSILQNVSLSKVRTIEDLPLKYLTKEQYEQARKIVGR